MWFNRTICQILKIPSFVPSSICLVLSCNRMKALLLQLEILSTSFLSWAPAGRPLTLRGIKSSRRMSSRPWNSFWKIFLQVKPVTSANESSSTLRHQQCSNNLSLSFVFVSRGYSTLIRIYWTSKATKYLSRRCWWRILRNQKLLSNLNLLPSILIIITNIHFSISSLSKVAFMVAV